MSLGARVSWGVIALVLVAGLVGCDRLVRWREDLDVTAPRTSLGVGESVEVSVKQKVSWLRTEPLTDPSKTRYSTTSESMLVVEPDGRVTCIGTNGKSRESAWISATNGKSHGHLSFDLRPEGPGPTLDITIAPTGLPALSDDARSAGTACCSTPVPVRESQQLRFKVQARGSGQDLTRSATGTRYTLFVGSGRPNDEQPSTVTGGPDAVSARSFRIEDEQGTMTAPASLARLHHARVIVFARNRDLVGWREIVIVRN